jgi:hypothetical protein
LGIIGAFLFAIALSDAPRLHEHFHKLLGADHECAVTIVLSGACDHLAGGAPVAAPVALQWTSVFVPQQLQSLAAGLEFSRLEHAPPSFA